MSASAQPQRNAEWSFTVGHAIPVGAAALCLSWAGWFTWQAAQVYTRADEDHRRIAVLEMSGAETARSIGTIDRRLSGIEGMLSVALNRLPGRGPQ